MSNRSYAYKEAQEVFNAFLFQFPVGMSNRSYRRMTQPEVADAVVFQFPVGMSNRSYLEKRVKRLEGDLQRLSIPRGNVE